MPGGGADPGHSAARGVGAPSGGKSKDGGAARAAGARGPREEGLGPVARRCRLRHGRHGEGRTRRGRPRRGESGRPCTRRHHNPLDTHNVHGALAAVVCRDPKLAAVIAVA